MPSSFFKQKRLPWKTYTLYGTWFECSQIDCPVFKCPKIEQDKNFIKFRQFPMLRQLKLEMDDFLQKLKNVVRIVLYGPAVSQSDCKKAGPYQLPSNNVIYSF